MARKGFMDGYKTNAGARGSASEWRSAFHERMGLDAARATVGDDSPEGILGLARGASWDVIRAAHRRLARLHHPDLGGDPGAFRRIQAAFEILENRNG